MNVTLLLCWTVTISAVLIVAMVLGALYVLASTSSTGLDYFFAGSLLAYALVLYVYLYWVLP